MKVRREWIYRPCRVGACVLILAPVIAGADEGGRSGNGSYGSGSYGSASGATAGASATGSASSPSSPSSASGASSASSASATGGVSHDSMSRDDSRGVKSGDSGRCGAQTCSKIIGVGDASANPQVRGAAEGSPATIGPPLDIGTLHQHLLQKRHPIAARIVDERAPMALPKVNKAIARQIGSDPRAPILAAGAHPHEDVLPLPRPAVIDPAASVSIASEIRKTQTRPHTVALPLKRTAALAVPQVAQQHSTQLILTEDNVEFIRECTHRDVAIIANNGRFILTGGCRSLTVSGSGNKALVEMAAGGEVDVLHRLNIVAWAKPDAGLDPILFSTGKANVVVDLSLEPKSGPTQIENRSPATEKPSDVQSVAVVDGPSNASTLNYISEKIPQSNGELIILSVSNTKLVRDCANKDVAVSASGSNVVLTGGCRSVTVSGNGNKILAEIIGGGELTVLQSRNAVAWEKVGLSLDPVVVHAEPSNRTIELAKVAGRSSQQGTETAP
jgi:hypothetical protein